jgi:hypothetical protein
MMWLATITIVIEQMNIDAIVFSRHGISGGADGIQLGR